MKKHPTLPALRRSALAAAALAATAAAIAAPPRATLQVLPTLGGTYGAALDLNDAGQVVGSSFTAAGTSGAFIWDAAGGIRAIPGASGAGAAAYAINAQGQVVGSTSTQGFIWEAASGLRLLSSAPDTSARAYAINDAGQIAGESRSWQAVAWQNPGEMRQLSSTNGQASAIDPSGRVIGYEFVNGYQQATRWLPDGTPERLAGSLGAATQSAALATNAVGQVVGWSGSAGGEATLWEAGMGGRTLGRLGGLNSSAEAINAAGQVVGLVDRGSGLYGGFLWRDGAGMSDLNPFFASVAPRRVLPSAINAHGQIAGQIMRQDFTDRAFLLTLHPDWTGGDGAWDDSTGTRWNWAGTGTAAARVGRMHDVVIDPGFSVTVKGSAEGAARTLRLGGTAGTLVTLDLNGGSTRVGDGDPVFYNPSTVGAGGVLRGNGRLEVREDLRVGAGGRIQVDGGQQMQLAIDYLDNQGLVRAQGTAAAPARLEVTGGAFYNQTGAVVQLVQADAVLDSGLSNFGQLSLQSAALTLGAGTRLFNFKGAQVAIGFGDSLVNGRIENQGLLVVSNGARASFFGPVANSGELRVSAGGAADFFGLVSGTGAIKGDGEVRFEGGLTIGGPTAVEVTPDAVFASMIGLVLDGAQRLAFGGDVRLEGASLALSWAEAGRIGVGTRFDLFDWNGSLSGRFDTLALPELGNGLLWDTSDLYAGGTLAVAAVPEPGSWALMAVGLLGLTRLKRLKRLTRLTRPTRRHAAP